MKNTDFFLTPEFRVDHFHVIKLYNDKLTKLRRDLQNDAENAELKGVFNIENTIFFFFSIKY